MKDVPVTVMNGYSLSLTIQLRAYSGAKRVSQTAQTLLEVKDLLELTGNFERAENIAHVSGSSAQNKFLRNQ